MTSPSDAQYNLVLVSDARVIERWDVERLAEEVRRVAPDVQTTIWDDGADGVPPLPDVPTMTFSPGPIRGRRPVRGRIFEGRSLSKSEEYAAVTTLGVDVPRWTLLTRDRAPDLRDFGRYVVVKPDRGGRGADVKIKRKGRVRWSAPSTELAKTINGGACAWVVQEFVYTGPHPVSYRVTSLFGEPIWSWKVAADPRRNPLRHREDFDGDHGGGMSIVSSGRGCVFSPVDDPELAGVARTVHRAFPEIPLIGVDLLRDADGGRVFFIEANTIGWTWHLSSPVGRAIQAEFGFDLDARFDVRRRAARILAEQVRRHAR